MKLPEENTATLDALVKVVEAGNKLKMNKLDTEWWINKIHELQDFVISNGVRGEIDGFRPPASDSFQIRPIR